MIFISLPRALCVCARTRGRLIFWTSRATIRFVRSMQVFGLVAPIHSGAPFPVNLLAQRSSSFYLRHAESIYLFFSIMYDSKMMIDEIASARAHRALKLCAQSYASSANWIAIFICL